MNVDVNSILASVLPKTPLGDSGFSKIPTDYQGNATPALMDKVDLASFPPKMSGVVPGSYENACVYEEDWSVFTSDTKIAYEGQDGSKMFIDFSYTSISKKVHYEVLESVKGVADKPEFHKHPMGNYFGPKATANRILQFATGLVNKFMAMEGDDKEKLAKYIQKLLKAIEKGFQGLHKAGGLIPHQIAGMVGETHDRVMNGMASLRDELTGGGGTTQNRLVYDEEITYTSTSIEISIMA